jgi:hypothetical protein
MEKCIEVVYLKACEINTSFGNPRKISKKKIEELVASLEYFGDFGVFIIDENNSVIAGNQRLSVVKSINPNTEVLCKRLIGYTEAEKRAINIKDNTHAGEWDLDVLASWTADLNIDLGLDVPAQKHEERGIREMELLHYEKYDYVMIVCRDELSYNSLVRALGIEDKKVLIGPKKRPIKARAIWYDDMKVDLVPK